jgi:biopolymer transport protein ExbD
MRMLINRNRKMSLLRSIHLVATIFTLTIIFASTTTLVSASTIGNNTTTTTSVGGEEQEAVSTMTTTNNVSNAALGSLFLTEKLNSQALTQSIKHTLRYHMWATQQ